MNSTIPFGLGPSPRPEYLYVSTDHSLSGWHRWDHAKNEPIAVEHSALTGFVRAVEMKEKEFQGKKSQKLCVHVAAPPRNYVIQSGLETHFSRGLLAALVRLSPSHFDHALCIEVQPGDEGKVVFANLFNAENGKPIYSTDEAREADPEALFGVVAGRIEENRSGVQG